MKRTIDDALEGMFVKVTPHIQKDIDKAKQEIKNIALGELPEKDCCITLNLLRRFKCDGCSVNKYRTCTYEVRNQTIDQITEGIKGL